MRPISLTVALYTVAAAIACSAPSTSYAIPPESGAEAGGVSLEVTDTWGGHLPTFWQGGRTYVLGQEGQRYRIRIHNRSGRRIEAVVSVDGRDAIDGKSASFAKPGYVVPAWGSVTVDGFRLSLRDVAAFRFSPVADSYAAMMGDARNVGVIGVAVFRERTYRPRPPVYYRDPAPYPEPPYSGCDDDWAQGGSAQERSAATPAPTKAADAPAEPKAAAKAESAPGAPDRGAYGGGSGSGRHAPPPPESRPGLGTAFGERDLSPASHVRFERARPGSPDHVLAVRYNDRPGLLALGIDVDRGHRPWWYRDDEPRRREQARPFAELPFASPPPGWGR
jgi:hypothetical protein